MPQVKLSAIDRFFRCRIQHYNPIKYWKYRADVTSCVGGGVHEKTDMQNEIAVY